MKTDNETWLIYKGDKIIEKKSQESSDSLTELEIAIYDLWVIDYSIRNSGTLEPMRELSENSLSRLIEFAKNNNCNLLFPMLELAKNKKLFCDAYYLNFKNACNDLRNFTGTELTK